MHRWIPLVGLLAALLAHADDEAIGYVKTVTGEAVVMTADVAATATPGTPVFVGSRLKTGAQGSIGVALRDDTLISCGPDTTLTIDEYFYAPAKNKLSFIGYLAKGTLNYVSGVIAKLKPEAVNIRTPSGTIGVRGTQFVARVDEALP